MLQCCQWRSVAGRVEAAGRCRGAQPAVINHSFRTATTQPPHPTQRVVHHASRTDRSAGQKDAALLLQLGFPVTAGRHAVRVQAGTERGLTTDGSADPCENRLSFCEDRWSWRGHQPRRGVWVVLCRVVCSVAAQWQRDRGLCAVVFT